MSACRHAIDVDREGSRLTAELGQSVDEATACSALWIVTSNSCAGACGVVCIPHLCHACWCWVCQAEDEEEEEQCLMREAADEHELTMAEQDEEQQQKNRLVLERRGKVGE